MNAPVDLAKFGDYARDRSAFSTLARRAGAEFVPLDWGLRTADGMPLTIDIAVLGARRPRTVLIHSSGLHGREYVGGAIVQHALLGSPPRLPPDCALILAHVLNPYGAAYFRRVDENNVDPNRAFWPEGGFAGAPPLYERIDGFLNPKSPPRSDGYYARALLLMARHGYAPLEQAIAGGQYEFPEGLFYGGRELPERHRHCFEFLQSRCEAAERVMAIDVHSGLGRYGEDTLIVNAAPGCETYRRLERIFGARVDSYYDTRGSYTLALEQRLAVPTVAAFVQEFGTYHPLRILHALREENRCHLHGDADISHPAKQRLDAVFAPRANKWRMKVLNRGLHVVSRALTALIDERSWA